MLNIMFFDNVCLVENKLFLQAIDGLQLSV